MNLRGTAAPGTAGGLSHKRILVIFAGLMMGLLLAALDQTIVATALLRIVGELGGVDSLSWVVTAYMLAATVSVPLYGKISDIYGHKQIFQAAIVIFLVGSALCGIAQNMIQLVVFRAVQGLGAGGLISLTMAIIGDILSPRERGRYQGYLGAVFAFASVVGPLLGGFLSDNLSWRWVFYINLPVGLAALLITSFALDLPFARRDHRIDYLGAALLAGGAMALLLAFVWGGHTYPWGSGQILGLTLVGVLALVAFFLQERRAAEPIVPLHLFSNSIFSVGFGSGIHGRHRDVRSDRVPPGVSPTRDRSQRHRFGAAFNSTDAGHHRHLGRVGAAHLPHRSLSNLSDRRDRGHGRGFWSARKFRREYHPRSGDGRHDSDRGRAGEHHAGDRACRSELRRQARPGDCHIGIDVLPLDRRNRRHRHLRSDSQQPARVQPHRALRGLTCARRRGPDRRQPVAAARPHPSLTNGCGTRGARVVASSIHVAFLVGVPLAVIAFLLSWFMKEIPLRETANVGSLEGAEGAMVTELSEGVPPDDSPDLTGGGSAESPVKRRPAAR